MFPRRPRTPWSLLLACLLTLAACGGGGGGTANVEADPAVLATRPAHGDQDVPETTPIEIDLAVAVDPAAVLSNYLSVGVPGHAVPGTWSYDAVEHRLTFVAADDLPIGAELRVEMAPGLPTMGGGQITQPFAFEFETRAPEFGDAAYLETVSDTAAQAVLAVHPGGNGLALYSMIRTDGRPEVSARFKPAGGDFEARKGILMGEGVNIPERGVAVNARGDAVWAWTNSIPNGDLGYCKFYDRQTDSWSVTQLFQNYINKTMGAPSVSIDDDGNVFFAWEETPDATGEPVLAARRWTPAGGFEPVQVFDSGDGSTNMIHVAANARGDAAVAWQQTDATGVTSCYGTYYTRSTGWFGQALLETVADWPCYVRGLAIAPDGHAAALLAVKDGPGSYDELPSVVTRFPEGHANAGWSAPVPVPGDRGELSDYGMYATADNRFFAVYSLVTDISYAGYVRAAAYDPAAGSVLPHLLSQPSADDVDGGDLVASLSPGGELLVAWTEATNTAEDTLKAAVVRSDGHLVADIPLTVLPAGQDVRALAVAVAPGGGGLVAWSEPDPAGPTPVARRLPTVRIDPAGAVAPATYQQAPPGDVATAPLLSLDEMGRGALVWRQEDSTNGRKDFRYRLID